MSGARRSQLGRRDLRYRRPEAQWLLPARRFRAKPEAQLGLRQAACRPRPLPAAAAATAAAVTLVLAGGCSSGTGSSPARLSADPTASAAVASCRQQYASACYTPRQLRVAYDIQPLLDRGTDGRGQTVVLMEFANTPQQPAPQVTDIRQDLALFDAVFGLPAPRLQVDTSLAGSAWPWLAGSEEVEDAEIVHAVAPDAAIRVILIPSWTGPGSWITAVGSVLRLALAQGSVVSLSAILGEDCFTPAQVAGLKAALQADQEHHVTVVASSGDFGAASTACAGPGGKDYFYPGAGTSAATPLWAALIALADQYSGRHLGFVNPAIYRIGRSANYHQAFHDITTGNSTLTFPQGTITGYAASPGWDPVTGWGSPNAQALILLLARYASP